MKQYQTNLLFFFICFTTFLHAQTFTISGYIFNQKSKETLAGVQIGNIKQNAGTISNGYGFYSLSLKKDSIQLLIRFLGYAPKLLDFYLDRNITYNIELEEMETELGQVEIFEKRQDKSVRNDIRVSVIEIRVSQVKELPALFGEKDVFKVIQLLPGVQKGSEGNVGLYVRGGGPDQNLIILDDANVYNAFHLFGFFSVFNGDALKSIELTKGGFPARYGGRISSVLDMRLKDGNKQTFHGEGGIGMIASRLMLEGPLKKGKSSFLISLRRTYADLIVRPLLPKDSMTGYYFYDINAKFNYTLNTKNRIFLSGYFGRDLFHTYFSHSPISDSKASIEWGNKTTTFRWNHIFGPKVFSNLSLLFSDYNFDLRNTEKNPNGIYSLKLLSAIRDQSLKYDFEILSNPRNHIRFGIISTYHTFTPQAVAVKNPTNEHSNIKKQYALESAIYIEDDYELNEKIKLNAGLRISSYLVNKHHFLNPEPRLNIQYLIKKTLSFKIGYSMMNQYLLLLSNTGVGLPTDLWVPATERTKPQNSQQIAGGFFKDLEYKKENYTFSIEGYYKLSKNVIAYKEGASFYSVVDPFNNSENKKTWEDAVSSGEGTSYGCELFFQKKEGKFTGWIGYTLSWSTMQFDSLNNGKKFWARYDRRHDISMVGIYKWNKHITFSAVWVYGTGNAVTLPYGSQLVVPPQVTNFNVFNHNYFIDAYAGRNEFRMAPYHRLDISVQFHRKLKHWEQTWDFSIYNTYNRKNPYFYYIGANSKTPWKRSLKQVSIFPILPGISYSFKF